MAETSGWSSGHGSGYWTVSDDTEPVYRLNEWTVGRMQYAEVLRAHVRSRLHMIVADAESSQIQAHSSAPPTFANPWEFALSDLDDEMTMGFDIEFGMEGVARARISTLEQTDEWVRVQRDRPRVMKTLSIEVP